MSAKIIDGKQIAAEIKEQVKAAVTKRIGKGLKAPGLATVLVGNNPASSIYVRSKHKACEEIGIRSFSHNLPENSRQEDVEAWLNSSIKTRMSMASWFSCPCLPVWMKNGF